MTHGSILVKEQHIQNLGGFARALAAGLQRSAPASDSILRAAGVSMSGECIQCGIRVTGEELLALAAATPSEDLHARATRLRQGYCARNGCDCYYYRLIFRNHPDIDWTRILSQGELMSREPVNRISSDDVTGGVSRKAMRRRLAGRAGLGLAAIALLLLVRQWYLGGTIPLLREPENFRVDPLPPDRQSSR